MWRAGQIVTIGGVVFRVIRRKEGHHVCDRCYFDLNRVGCALHVQSSTIEGCEKLIPEDCYFKRLSPITMGYLQCSLFDIENNPKS